jgi:hypothetical protein
MSDDPLTDAELAQLVADIAGMADGWGKGRMGWLTIPDAFNELAPRITAALVAQADEVRRLRARVAELEAAEERLEQNAMDRNLNDP